MEVAGALAGEPGMKQQTYVMQERMESANENAGPNGKGWSDEGVAFTLEARHRPQTVATQWAVRRLLPVECERLQGFPDGWTDVIHRGKPAADGPRYKAIGNSKATTVVRWIGKRILRAVEELQA
jgi:DNA (cytosine-5)-methyltransferase 1